MLACETSERMSERTRKIRQTAAGKRRGGIKGREKENKNASDGKAALMSV